MSIDQTLLDIYSAQPQLPPMGMAEGGEVSREEMMMQAAEGVAGQANPDEAIRSSIEELLAQASQTEDPSERDQYLHLAEAAEIGAEAPMAEMAIQLAQAGRGEDTALAHVRPGEVVIPPEAFEDPEFESLIEKKFKELNIDPARMVVGVGIASLNPITGLEEFGWFKKVAKSAKKVVTKVIKPLAAVAQFIPGPWQPFAALANKAFTVYDVAKGRASPLSLLSLGTPVPGGGGSSGIGSLFSTAKDFVTKGSDGVGLLGNIGKGIGNIGKGIGSLVTGTGADGVGRFGKLGDLVTGTGADGAALSGDYLGLEDELAGIPNIDLLAQGRGTPQFIKTIGDYLGLGGQSGLEDVYGAGTTNPLSGMLGGLFGGSGAGGSGGGGLNLGGLGGAGIAAVLTKLAYDEAKNRKGVQLSPAMTMSRYGGYQLAKRDAEAAGLPAPDRRDFGMMEDMPLLSGGRKIPAAEEPVTGMRYGGAVMPTQMRYDGMVPMAYATGGKVSTEDFKKKNGKINGEGTETSDDIPAMLSDGEFVMTGQAVRGAGAFDMDSNNGIITLTPNGGEDGDKGTQLLYQMMDLFAEYADKPRPKRVKAA